MFKPNARSSLGFLSRTLILAMAIGLPMQASASMQPELKKDRLWLKTNYLETPEEGIYELAFDNKNNRVFASVMDRVHRKENIGYLYAFDAQNLAELGRYKMPYRAFSVTMDQSGGRVYVGHTQAASLRISLVDPTSGKVIRTSERLQFGKDNNNLNEHLRHMVYSKAANALFVSYSNSVEENGVKKQIHKLLVLDGDSLKYLGEVENAYPEFAYGMTLDEKNQKIYLSGTYVNEIDPVTRKVVRTLNLDAAKPKVTNLQGIAIDPDGGRIFATEFNHEDRTGANDGLYVFDLKTGKQLGYIHTGAGALSVKYSAKHNEAYVTNFTAGTISVVNANDYTVTQQIKAPVFPNQMTLSADQSTLYVSVKEGFSRAWNPDEFVEGAKERILSISLDKDPVNKNASKAQ